MKRNLADFTHGPFDLLVIGGGIYGATLAWKGSSAGLKTALVEKGDFGQATSANTQKIIHGGLRYLQSFDLLRVLESLRARKYMMQLAPHLVDPLRCIMPIYGHGAKGREAVAVGLFFYNLLSHGNNVGMPLSKQIPPCRILSESDTRRLVPDLHARGLKGGAEWYDALCKNTERMLLGFIKSAYSAGARMANYVNAEHIEQHHSDMVSVSCRDLIGKVRFKIAARKVANCCGPWIKDLMEPAAADKLLGDFHLTAGVNVVTRAVFTHEAAVGLRDPADPHGRLYFVVPWKGQSIIGTEWFTYRGRPEQFKVNEAHCVELLTGFNRTYPSARLTLDDIRHVHGGLVPSDPVQGSSGAQGKLWKHFRLIDQSENGHKRVVSVIGVKYTTAVDVAQRVLGFLFPALKTERRGITLDQAGSGEPMAWMAGLQNRWASVVGESQVQRMGMTYGMEAEEVLNLSVQEATVPGSKSKAFDLIRGETIYAIESEMAQTLVDIVRRRTDRGADGLPAEEELKRLAECSAGLLGWTPTRMQKEIEGVRQEDVRFR